MNGAVLLVHLRLENLMNILMLALSAAHLLGVISVKAFTKAYFWLTCDNQPNNL